MNGGRMRDAHKLEPKCLSSTGELIDIERVRPGTHRVNCPQKGPKFKVNGFEATHLT